MIYDILYFIDIIMGPLTAILFVWYWYFKKKEYQEWYDNRNRDK